MNTIKFCMFLACLAVFISLKAQAENIPATIEIKLSEEDGKKNITATAYESAGDSISGNPIPEIDLYFYVERSFSLLPIGDVFNTTDENGEVTVEFPADLPGDTAGNVRIIVKIQDSDTYMNTEVAKTINWGIPLNSIKTGNGRSLWAAGANAPITLLLLVNSLIAAAWGLIFFILFKIYKISKM
ncbi:MAG TPA: hypothetical protein VI583_11515 [Cyclobacteriaceae bacterium]|nr:hypothetical protein [Cyclobacteriaceae bacterium]